MTGMIHPVHLQPNMDIGRARHSIETYQCQTFPACHQNFSLCTFTN